MCPSFYLNLSASCFAVRKMKTEMIKTLLNSYENGDLMDFFGNYLDMNSIVIGFGELKIFFFDDKDDIWVHPGALKQICKDLAIPFPERVVEKHLAQCWRDAVMAAKEIAQSEQAILRLKDRITLMQSLDEQLKQGKEKVQRQMEKILATPTLEEGNSTRLYVFHHLQELLIKFLRIGEILKFEHKIVRVQRRCVTY